MAAPRNPAKPHSRHKRGTVGSRTALIELPASGSTWPVPPMPAGRSWTEHEVARWDELWKSPQAQQWDESARTTVAILIVYETAILSGEAAAWQAQEARYAGEALGLTPRALAQLGWRISDD